MLAGLDRAGPGVRVCYAAALERRPDLRGALAIRFVIGRDGAISEIAEGASTVPSPELILCARRAFAPLSFPRPEGGVVTVVARYELSPG